MLEASTCIAILFGFASIILWTAVRMYKANLKHDRNTRDRELLESAYLDGVDVMINLGFFIAAFVCYGVLVYYIATHWSVWFS